MATESAKRRRPSHRNRPLAVQCSSITVDNRICFIRCDGCSREIGKRMDMDMDMCILLKNTDIHAEAEVENYKR